MSLVGDVDEAHEKLRVARELPVLREPRAMAVTDEVVVVAGKAGDIVAFDAQSGKKLSEIKVAGTGIPAVRVCNMKMKQTLPGIYHTGRYGWFFNIHMKRIQMQTNIVHVHFIYEIKPFSHCI